MNKLFFAICFSLFVVALTKNLQAEVRSVASPTEIAQNEVKTKSKPPVNNDPISFSSADDAKDYILDRIENAVMTYLDEDPNTIGSMNIQKSDEYIAMQKEANKPYFQKVYEQAIARVSSQQDVAQQRQAVEQQRPLTQEEIDAHREAWIKSLDFDVVGIDFPFAKEKVLVPAKEHIPYLFTEIEVLPSGVLKFRERIYVVANGEKLKKGLVRAIPKYSTSRAGERNRIDINLISVRMNGKEVAYKLKETNTDILIVPKNEKILTPGVYTYEIEYMIDRRLWRYDEFNEIYWDITGSNWNLVIARAGATLKLPNGNKPLGQTLLIGYPGTLSPNASRIMSYDSGVTGFVSARALFAGEGMHFIASIPKEGIEELGISKRFDWFVNDYGDVLFALLAFAAVAGAYYLSWKGMRNDNSRQKTSMKKNAQILRYLLKGIFDKVSFGAFVLEMYRRNIIDIRNDAGSVVLVKNTDATKGLSKAEKKALGELFLNKESTLSVNSNNSLKLKRAFKWIEQDTVKKFKSFALKLNIGYLLFSVGMLLIAEAFISMLSVDSAQTFMVIATSSVAMGIYLWLWNKNVDNNVVKWIVRAFIVVVMLFTFFAATVFVHFITAVIIFAIVYAIFSFTALFAKRDGLARGNIDYAKEFEKYLVENKDTISLGRDFFAQQPNIYALNLVSEYPVNERIAENYKLDLVDDIVSLL